MSSCRRIRSPFILTIVCDAIGDGPYPSTRQARVERKHGAYHEAFEVHGQMVLHRTVGVNIRINLV